MTKAIKFWKRFSFWFKVRTFLGSIGVTSEVAAYFADAGKGIHTAIGAATVLALLITFLFTDEDKNDIVDFFQKSSRKR
jgi:hypothetical protein